MADDEETTGTGFGEVLRQGLPQLLLGPAGKAISQLVGAGVDIPAAWLEARAQAIRDQTEASSTVMRALAASSAALGTEDRALLERGLNKLVGKVYREQKNREAVAEVTIRSVAKEPLGPEAADPDEEWMSRFEDAAAHASSETMRELFGRVLAGEIRKPSSFSRSTIHFMSLLDHRAAVAFAKLCPHQLNRGIIFLGIMNDLLSIADQHYLESLGLITLPSLMTYDATRLPDGRFAYFAAKLAYIGHFLERNLKLLGPEVCVLTVSGLELSSVIEYEHRSDKIVEELRRLNFTDVTIGRLEHMSADMANILDEYPA